SDGFLFKSSKRFQLVTPTSKHILPARPRATNDTNSDRIGRLVVVPYLDQVEIVFLFGQRNQGENLQGDCRPLVILVDFRSGADGLVDPLLYRVHTLERYRTLIGLRQSQLIFQTKFVTLVLPLFKLFVVVDQFLDFFYQKCFCHNFEFCFLKCSSTSLHAWSTLPAGVTPLRLKCSSTLLN